MRVECKKLSFSRILEEGSASLLLDEVSVCFPDGGVSWIQGPNGCGKSTLMHLLAGLLRPVSGEILADGEPVSRWVSSHRDRWRRQVGIVFQQPRLFDGLSVTENVLVPLVPRLKSFEPDLPRVSELLDRLGLASLATRRVERLSGGERQRVGVARALVNRPGLILADEPTAHQDEEGKRLVLSLLEEAGKNGATVVLTSHDGVIPEILGVDLRLRLSDGRLEPLR